MYEALRIEDPATQSLLGIYAYDIMWNCGTIERSFLSVETYLQESKIELGVAPETHLTIVDAVLQRHLITIVNSAANLSKLIRPAVKRSQSETKSAHKFRKSRLDFFNSILIGAEINEIHNTSVRNALEHFDEYLDDEVRRHMRNPQHEDVTRFYNFSLAYENALELDKQIRYLRAYLIHEGIFIVFDRRVNIRTIVHEARVIRQRVRQSFHLQDDAGDCGVVIK